MFCKEDLEQLFPCFKLYFIHLEHEKNLKYNNSQRDKMEKDSITTEYQDQCMKDDITALGQFLTFVMRMEDIPEANLRISFFYCTIRLSAFYDLQTEIGHSNNTKANKSSYIKRFLNWLGRQDEYKPEFPVISGAVAMLKLQRKTNRKSCNYEDNRKNVSPKEAWKNGKFLKKGELEFVWKQLLLDLEKTLKTIQKQPSKKKATKFQQLLITLCLFASLGQRKQVWVTLEIRKIYLDTFSLNDKNDAGYWKMLLVPEKVARPCYIDGIVIPEYLARLLIYFEYHVRTHLQPASSSVCAMWLNSFGRPLGPKKFTYLVTTCIKKYYPRKKITPAIIRRVMASHLVNEMKSQQFDKSKQDTLLLEFSHYINTGLSMVEKFYNRSQQGCSAFQLQQNVQHIILDSPSSQELQQSIQQALQETAFYDSVQPVFHNQGLFVLLVLVDVSATNDDMLSDTEDVPQVTVSDDESDDSLADCESGDDFQVDFLNSNLAVTGCKRKLTKVSNSEIECLHLQLQDAEQRADYYQLLCITYFNELSEVKRKLHKLESC